MDSCKTCSGVYQYAATDDCSRDLVFDVVHRPTAAAAPVFLALVLDEMPFGIPRI